jgi:outer membrane protein
MKTLVKLAIVSALCVSGLAFAANSSNPTKIGVIDVQKIIQQTPETAKLNTVLDQQFKPRQEKLMTMNNQLRAQQEKFNKESSIMSSKDREQLRNKIVKDQDELQKQAQAYQTELNDARNKDLQQLYNKIQVAVDEVAKQQQFDIILERQAVPFVSTQYDVTDDVLKKLSS